MFQDDRAMAWRRQREDVDRREGGQPPPWVPHLWHLSQQSRRPCPVPPLSGKLL